MLEHRMTGNTRFFVVQTLASLDLQEPLVYLRTDQRLAPVLWEVYGHPEVELLWNYSLSSLPFLSPVTVLPLSLSHSGEPEFSRSEEIPNSLVLPFTGQTWGCDHCNEEFLFDVNELRMEIQKKHAKSQHLSSSF